MTDATPGTAAALMPVEVKGLCQSLLESFAARARDRRITFDLALAPEPAVVAGFPGLLALAVARLMTRALLAMPDGGTVSLSVSNREGQVVIECGDHGGDVRTNLRPVRVAARAMGGFLRRLDAGRGTRFAIVLPALDRQIVAA